MSKFLHETRKMIENPTKEVEDLKRVNMQISEQNIELQKQLAESEEAIKYLKGIKRYDVGEMLTENIQLKQQLTEKEKLINEYADSLNKVLIEQADLVYRHDQDKISFCIEKLEQVRKHFVYCGNEMVSDYGLNCEVDELKAEIDNQIEELKKEMK